VTEEVRKRGIDRGETLAAAVKMHQDVYMYGRGEYYKYHPYIYVHHLGSFPAQTALFGIELGLV
jgi:hypothetical protein